MNDIEKKNYFTERINKSILEFYENHDLRNTIALGRCLLNCKYGKDKEDFRTAVHGEVCESILEVMIKEFLKKNNLEKRWFYTKGLVLKDLNNLDSDYLTEIDFILFSPHKIFLFECKSYGGKKYLKDKCTIVRAKKKPFDVFKQHEKHSNVLLNNFLGFRAPEKEGEEKIAPVQLLLFDFSNGDLTDQRTELWKKVMPVVDENTLGKFLSNYKDVPGNWDVKALYKAVKMINKNNDKRRDKHLQYVKDLAKQREGK